MNTNLAKQFAAAAVQFGPAQLPISDDDLISRLEAVQVSDNIYFAGVIRPQSSPAGWLPSDDKPIPVYLAVTGGTYSGFSDIGVDEGEIAIVGPEDGRTWSKITVYSPSEEVAANTLSMLTLNSGAAGFESASDLDKAGAAEALGISEADLDKLFSGGFLRLQYTAGILGVDYVSSSLVSLGAAGSVSVVVAKEDDAYAISVSSHDFSDDFNDDLNG